MEEDDEDNFSEDEVLLIDEEDADHHDHHDDHHHTFQQAPRLPSHPPSQLPSPPPPHSPQLPQDSSQPLNSCHQPLFNGCARMDEALSFIPCCVLIHPKVPGCVLAGSETGKVYVLQISTEGGIRTVVSSVAVCSLPGSIQALAFCHTLGAFSGGRSVFAAGDSSGRVTLLRAPALHESSEGVKRAKTTSEGTPSRKTVAFNTHKAPATLTEMAYFSPSTAPVVDVCVRYDATFDFEVIAGDVSGVLQAWIPCHTTWRLAVATPSRAIPHRLNVAVSSSWSCLAFNNANGSSSNDGNAESVSIMNAVTVPTSVTCLIPLALADPTSGFHQNTACHTLMVVCSDGWIQCIPPGYGQSVQSLPTTWQQEAESSSRCEDDDVVACACSLSASALLSPDNCSSVEHEGQSDWSLAVALGWRSGLVTVLQPGPVCSGTNNGSALSKRCDACCGVTRFTDDTTSHQRLCSRTVVTLDFPLVCLVSVPKPGKGWDIVAGGAYHGIGVVTFVHSYCSVVGPDSPPPNASPRIQSDGAVRLIQLSDWTSCIAVTSKQEQQQEDHQPMLLVGVASGRLVELAT